MNQKPKKTRRPPTGVKALTNFIGDRGEKMFELAITDYSALQKPIFKPGFLGDKWPTVDFYVELLEVPNSAPYFFVQVKTTTTDLLPTDTTLNVQVSKSKCELLHRLPAPTYVIGVHEPSKRAFIKSLHKKPTTGISGIPLTHELNPGSLPILYDEVKAFWSSNTSKPTGSHFS